MKTCVVSTDRDAFQLVSENVCLMMTPRGVADVQVYTPERVEARYGIQPSQIPDFIGLKGDTSDNIPGIPGIGDKTAGQLIAQYGSLEEVVEHAAELSPARSKAIAENAEQAAASKLLATMRRDLDLGVETAGLVLQPPDRSELKEIFRRFEFRGLLSRVDTLDEALPAAERPEAVSETVPWHEGDLSGLRGRVGVAIDEERLAYATGSEVVVAPRPTDTVAQGESAAIVAHDAKQLRLGEPAADDTMLLAYLIDPGRAEYELDDLMAEYGIELAPDPQAEEETAALVRHAEAARRLAEPLAAKVVDRGSERLYRDVELPLSVVLGAMEDAASASTRIAWARSPLACGPERGARGSRVRPRRRGVRPRLAAAARPHSLREARPHAGAEGEDRLLHGLQGPPRDPRRSRDRPRDRGVA